MMTSPVADIMSMAQRSLSVNPSRNLRCLRARAGMIASGYTYARRIAARKPNLEISARLVPAHWFSSRFPVSRADGSLLCVRRTDCGLRLNDRAPAASIRLTQCKPQTALYCSSGRSSLRAAIASRLETSGDGENDAATQAFEAVRAEVAQLRRAVQQLTAQAATEMPDYAVTLGEISHNLAVTADRVDKLTKSPALSMTPAGIGAQINTAAAEARRGDKQLLDQARGDMTKAAVELIASVGSAREYEVQRRWLISIGLISLVSGALLSWLLSGPVARAVPGSWLWPEKMAARTLDQPMWEAGMHLMQTDGPVTWSGIVTGSRMITANKNALDNCWKAASKTKKAVPCSIRVGGEN